jgi:UDP-2,3-diacylglucosamine hydrolase
VSHFLFSDVHLRPDRPDRADRLARWARGLRNDDQLIVVGDLCDFWMASRVPESRLMDCPGLQALADFRSRGGRLRIMAGNHDLWLGAAYEKLLGAEPLPEPADLDLDGLRLHLVHGHLLGARSRWKGWMESQQFHRAFGQVPAPLAGLLDHALERKNERSLTADEERHLAVFRRYAEGLRGRTDLVVIGHVHRAVDDHQADPRMIVLGGWQRQTSFLRIDQGTVRFHVLDPSTPERPGASAAAWNHTLLDPRCTSP